MYQWHLEVKDNLCAYITDSYALYVRKIITSPGPLYSVVREDTYGEITASYRIKHNGIEYAVASGDKLKELLCFLK